MGDSNTPNTVRYAQLPPTMRRTGPHGLSPAPNRTGAFQHIRLSSSTRLLGSCKLIDNHPFQSAPVEAQRNLLHGVPRYAGEQGPTTSSVICFLWFAC